MLISKYKIIYINSGSNNSFHCEISQPLLICPASMLLRKHVGVTWTPHDLWYFTNHFKFWVISFPPFLEPSTDLYFNKFKNCSCETNSFAISDISWYNWFLDLSYEYSS